MSPDKLRQDEERSAVDAASGRSNKRAYVRTMFSSIAPRYDLLNHLLSFNVDRRWRRRAIQKLDWPRAPSGVYLDLCAGTLDVAAELSTQPGFVGSVIGADFAVPMLQAGRKKGRRTRVHPVGADALLLPLPKDSVAGAVVAFGARNLADLDAGLREVLRVLRPGGRFVILEFSTPRASVIRAAYHFYFHRLLPRIGGFVSGNHGAYRYLPESVSRFPSEEELATRLREAGFGHVEWESLTLGVAAIHVATKTHA
jgi:demethylmenaquinone methyltransferase / 2-methoxy-6-polyprenyl-1,4-benzoquinol methylase